MVESLKENPNRFLSGDLVFDETELPIRDEATRLNRFLTRDIASDVSDRLIREEAARFAGMAVCKDIVKLETAQPFDTFLDALHAYKKGDQLAKAMVWANVSVDVIERVIKAGFVTKDIPMGIAKDGTFFQHGQSYRKIQANSLNLASDHPVMERRSKAENTNNFRLEHLVRNNQLIDCYFVVISRAEKEEGLGFFTKTMSCSIQVSKQVDQQLITQAAFVAGKNSQGVEFDATVVSKLYKILAGVDISNLTPAEILDRPLLIPESIMPNGVIDIVKLYDYLAGGTFFGLDQPQEDYSEFVHKCQAREANYHETIQKVIDHLMAELDTITTPIEAAKKLNKLSEYYAVEQAVLDRDIDPMVFGGRSALHIHSARMAIDQGRQEQADRQLAYARQYAVSSSCPAALRSSASTGEGIDSALSSDEEGDQYGSLTFYCNNGHKNTRPRGKLIPRCLTEGCDAVVKCEA